jgi:hypothetical protein
MASEIIFSATCSGTPQLVKEYLQAAEADRIKSVPRGTKLTPQSSSQ